MHEANTSDDGHSGNKILSNQARLSRLGLGKEKLKQEEKRVPHTIPPLHSQPVPSWPFQPRSDHSSRLISFMK